MSSCWKKNQPKKMRYRSLLLICCCCVFFGSCISKRDGTSSQISEAAFIDTAFWQEYHEAFPTGNDKGVNEVRSITVAPGGDAWIATAGGVFIKKNGTTEWVDALPAADQGPSFAVETEGSAVWISTWNAVYRFKDNKLLRMNGLITPIASLCSTPDGIYAAGPNGLWLYTGERFQKREVIIGRSIRDVTSDGGHGLWLSTDVGLYHILNSDAKHFVDTSHLVSAYVRGVAVDSKLNVWVGGLGGVSVMDSAFKKIRTLRPQQGIPSLEVRCVESSPDKIMWIGTDAGIVRYYPDDTHSVRFSRRWLLNDKVNDIAFDASGDAWIATDGGVSVIRKKKMTLATKEAYFYDVLMRRHIREPWIAGQCRLPIAGDTTRWEPEDDDNDGEYTGNYLAMESFRYAVTKSEDARVKAKKAFGFLKLLLDVTGSDGFFARTIVPSDWTFVHDGNRSFTEREIADELIKEPRFKPVKVRWHKSKDGKWLWKGDTSSDEICGHMFGYFFYHELVADAAEKKIIASHVARIVDHLISHNFTLTDVDGKPSRWGIWTPDKLNHDPEWSPDRSLNSMELLSFVKFAHYVTGDEKYQNIYLRLINQDKYLENMAKVPQQNPAWFIYFDVILAAYQYPILLTSEKDPERLKFYQNHIDNWMSTRKNDQNPLVNFIYNYSRGRRSELDASIQFLTDTPLDLVDWTFDHSKRADVAAVNSPVLGELQVSELQPASVRATVRWDKNPWNISPGNPHVEREPVFWLLPYWMGRYLDMIR